MVTYPSSANINSTVFSVISEATYSNTEDLTTFSLPTYVNHLGQVFVIKERIILKLISILHLVAVR